MPPLTGQIYLRKLHNLWISLAFPLLLLILTLIFDQSLHSGHLLWTAVSIPVAESLLFIGNLRKIPAMLAAAADFQLAFLVLLALPSILTAYCTAVAEPSPIWEIGLYLSYAAWGACVERAFELPPFMSFIYFVLMLAFALPVELLSLFSDLICCVELLV